MSEVQSVGERRGHKLAPLQTNFSRPAPKTRSLRPRPEPMGSKVPLQSPAKRQSSKTSLRNLFGRDKSRGEPKLDGIVEAPTPPHPQTAIFSSPLSATPLSPPTTDAQSTVTSPTDLRPPSARRTTGIPDPKTPTQDQYGWKPPPLFQAYPQSTKHACLAAPALSADAILRLHATTARNASEVRTDNPLERDQAADAARKKREQRQRKHLRTLSGTINKVEWTRKIYVLANVGYILQYAGEGKNDRLPERMLLLGPKSVAFASDAIPGKHWVLQVSHNPTGDGESTMPETPKSRFPRFGFHKPNYRRLSRSFLLVFDNPDAMTSWLVAVRAEIEKRGGPQLTKEKHSNEDTMPQLRSKSSVRQMVKKDPHRISSLFLQPQTLQSPIEEDGQSVGGATWHSRRSSYTSAHRRSIIESRSGSVSTSRTEATNPTHGSSFASDTHSSIHNSPPANDGFYRSEEPLPEELDRVFARNLQHSQANRQSLPLSQPPSIAGLAEPQVNVSPVPEALLRSASPPPNFSVPSFSKKFVPPGGPIHIQTSPQSSLNGFVGRGSADSVVPTFVSPPHSPAFSVASSRHTESFEKKRILRPSTSEDALTKAVRSAPRGPKFPRAPNTTPPSGPLPDPHSSRPVSLVGRPGMAPQTISETTDEMESPQKLSCTSSDKQGTVNMLRRKSMPGLGITIGPPSAPPPNCPLPKLPCSANYPPSPLTPSTPKGGPSSGMGPSSPQRFYGSPPVQNHVENRRKSGLITDFDSNPSRASSRMA